MKPIFDKYQDIMIAQIYLYKNIPRMKKDKRHRDIDDEKDTLDELVDVDMHIIAHRRDKKSRMGNNKEIGVGWENPQTSDEFGDATAQGPRLYSAHIQLYRNLTSESEKKNIDETAKNKMKSMLEDIYAKDNRGRRDITGNQDIPTMSDLSDQYHKTLIVKKTQKLVELINDSDTSGVELAAILNFLFSENGLNIDSIPGNMLTNIRRKLT
jgi:hypothetical protein